MLIKLQNLFCFSRISYITKSVSFPLKQFWEIDVCQTWGSKKHPTQQPTSRPGQKNIVTQQREAGMSDMTCARYEHAIPPRERPTAFTLSFWVWPCSSARRLSTWSWELSRNEMEKQNTHRSYMYIYIYIYMSYHIILQFLHRKLAFQYEKHSTTKKLSIHMSTLLSSQFVTAARFYHSKPPLAAPVFAPGRIDGEVLSHKACHKGHPWLRSHQRPSSCVSETKGCDSSVFQQDVHTCMHEYTYIYIYIIYIYIYIYIHIYMYTYIVCTRTENQHMRWHYQILSHLDPYVNVIVYIYISFYNILYLHQWSLQPPPMPKWAADDAWVDPKLLRPSVHQWHQRHLRRLSMGKIAGFRSSEITINHASLR